MKTEQIDFWELKNEQKTELSEDQIIVKINEDLIKYRDNRPLEEQFKDKLSPRIKKLKENGKTDEEILNWVFERSQNGIKIDHYIENAQLFYDLNPFFYDENQLWWTWKENRWQITDDVEMSMQLDSILGFAGQTISSGVRNNHLEAMKWIGRQNKPQPAKLHWIQFKDKAYSLRKKVFYDVRPNYFFTNPIPWEVGNSSDTPNLDKLFKEWVGEKYIQDLYELIAYCCYQSYPIQIIVCLVGSGRNGKSSFLKILDLFFGKENICSTELDLITGNNSSRFETSKLYKKLICKLGETNFGTLNKSSMIKKLTGGDMIGFEMKGKHPFDDYNYAKVVISSNSLPTSEDTSEGFYRRWHIIEFPNNFPEGKDIIESVPKDEFKALARKIIDILPIMLERGSFTNQGSIDERKERYIKASNPLTIFIDSCCDKDPNFFVKYSEFYTHYCMWLGKNKRRIVSRKELTKNLSMEGYEIERTTKKINEDFVSATFIVGLKMHIVQVMSTFPISPIEDFSEGKILYNVHNLPNTKNNPKIPKIEDSKVIEESIQGQGGVLTSPLFAPPFNLLKITEDIISYCKDYKDNDVPFESLAIYFKDVINIDQLDKLVKMLLLKGDIYEPKSGFIKVLE